jgi:hypothetical protein
MYRSRNPFALVPLTAILVLASCKGAEQVCNPTDPLCGGGGGGVVASILVTSPVVDTVMAASRTAQLTAVARDAGGSALASQPTMTWNSLNPSIATVNGTGLVTGVSAGTATITATSSTVTGTISLRLVNANLPLVATLVADSMAVRLRQALGATPQAAVTAGLTTCATHRISGNLLALNTCLNSLIALGPPPIDNHDKVVLGVLDLFFDFARRQLQL